MNWYVIYTKSRSEKTVSEKLEAAGIHVYCPLLKIRRKWSDRWKWVEEPLFRSYCFVMLDDENRDAVFNIPGVVRYVSHCGKPAVVRSSEIDQLKHWLEEYSHDSFEYSAFQVQDRVQMRSGALMDYKAQVLSSSGKFLCLFLENLGVQIKVDLTKNIVEKITSV